MASQSGSGNHEGDEEVGGSEEEERIKQHLQALTGPSPDPSAPSPSLASRRLAAYLNPLLQIFRRSAMLWSRLAI